MKRIVILISISCSLQAAEHWSPANAGAYLDQRAAWWIDWKPAARDHGTFCISCHTTLPYVLARPALRTALGETDVSPEERRVLDSVKKRVRLWSEIEPEYNDQKSGIHKTDESRGTEAILNALILARYDSGATLSGDAHLAFDNMWSLQLKSGEKKGAFAWLNFHYQPWEADDSQFWGATLAAIAAGSAPASYRAQPAIAENLNLLKAYLRRDQAEQSLLTRLTLLWASTKFPGLLSSGQQTAIVADLTSRQRDDGGWSTSSLLDKTWKRKDGTPLDTQSDGYATGLIAFVLRQPGVPQSGVQLKSALSWLTQNQDASGKWSATSLNKQRDPSSDAGRFMSDAATAYSVLALSDSN